jgi:hypothetical protein
VNSSLAARNSSKKINLNAKSQISNKFTSSPKPSKQEQTRLASKKASLAKNSINSTLLPRHKTGTLPTQPSPPRSMMQSREFYRQLKDITNEHEGDSDQKQSVDMT